MLHPYLECSVLATYERMSGSRSPIRYGTECLNQHCDHILGLSVGSKLVAEEFLVGETLGILGLGIVAFGIGTMTGVLMAKLMNLFSKNKINPLIGAAGVSAVPMAARVANKVGIESDPDNFLIMHAMGPNVAGVIGSTIAAGVLIQFAA